MWMQPSETVKPALLSLRHTSVSSVLLGGGGGGDQAQLHREGDSVTQQILVELSLCSRRWGNNHIEGRP